MNSSRTYHPLNGGSTTRERHLGQEEVVTQNSQYQTDYEGEGFFSHEYTKAENWTAQHGNTHITGYYNTFEAGEHYDYKQLSTNSANPSSGPGIQHGYIYRTGHSGGEETYTSYPPYDPNSGGNQGGGGYGGGGYGGGSGSGSGSSSGSSSGGSSGGGSGTGSGEGQSSSSTVVLGGGSYAYFQKNQSVPPCNIPHCVPMRIRPLRFSHR